MCIRVYSLILVVMKKNVLTEYMCTEIFLRRCEIRLTTHSKIVRGKLFFTLIYPNLLLVFNHFKISQWVFSTTVMWTLWMSDL